MKICFLAGTLGPGGAERQLYYYLKSLIETGHSPYVLCLTKGGFWEKPILDLGIPVIWVGQSSNRLIRLFCIGKEIRQRPTEIIHSQHFHTNLYAYVVGITLHKKAIGSLRSDVFSEIKSLGWLGRLSFHLPALLVANSKAAIVTAETLKKPKNRLFFLPNVVDTNYFFPPPVRDYLEELQVIFVGTIWAPKRVDRIIRIAKKCLEEDLDICFKLYGDGEDKQQLSRFANELGVLNKNLHFMGQIVDVRTAYHHGDILLLTSDYEGTPNVVLEAMACGLTIVSTNVGDVNRLITNEINGFILDFPNIEEKAVNLFRAIINDRNIRINMGIINRKIIEREFSRDYLSPVLSDLYSR